MGRSKDNTNKTKNLWKKYSEFTLYTDGKRGRSSISDSLFKMCTDAFDSVEDYEKAVFEIEKCIFDPKNPHDPPKELYDQVMKARRDISKEIESIVGLLEFSDNIEYPDTSRKAAKKECISDLFEKIGEHE